MNCRFVTASAICLVCLAAVWAKRDRPEPPPDLAKLTPGALKKWSGAEVLLTGKLAQVIAGPVGLSQPPLRTYRFQIVPGAVLRGSATPGQPMAAVYSIHQEKEPTFPAPDQDCLVALKFVRDAWVVQSINDATAANVEQAKLATAFPLGWTVSDGKLVSPWAKVGKPAPAKGVACSVTGRPVLLVGPGVRLRVEPVPPKKNIQFVNPDGDGAYKLTVTNETKDEAVVPALLTDGQTVRWDESIVIRCQDKNYPVPGATGAVAGLKPVVLQPGESVSGTTHVFALDGPEWPRGGYRIEFQFCLGETSATHSFYYFSRHHDPIRAAVRAELGKKSAGQSR